MKHCYTILACLALATTAQSSLRKKTKCAINDANSWIKESAELRVDHPELQAAVTEAETALQEYHDVRASLRKSIQDLAAARAQAQKYQTDEQLVEALVAGDDTAGIAAAATAGNTVARDFLAIRARIEQHRAQYHGL